MSNHSKLRFLLVLLFAAFATAALVTADIGALAQNANGSTTGDASAENSNANMMSAPRRGRRGRRVSRKRAPAADAATAEAAAESAATGDASQTGDTSQPGDLSGEQTDLSGTYSGHVRMSGGHEMEGNATLTVTGNQFSLESGGMTHNGRVYAVIMRGYIGASFYFPDIPNTATSTPLVANVRVRKHGGLIWLTPVPNTQASLSFGSGGRTGPRTGGGRGRRGRRPAAETPPAEPPSDSTTPPM